MNLLRLVSYKILLSVFIPKKIQYKVISQNCLVPSKLSIEKYPSIISDYYSDRISRSEIIEYNNDEIIFIDGKYQHNKIIKKIK